MPWWVWLPASTQTRSQSELAPCLKHPLVRPCKQLIWLLYAARPFMWKGSQGFTGREGMRHWSLRARTPLFTHRPLLSLSLHTCSRLPSLFVSLDMSPPTEMATATGWTLSTLAALRASCVVVAYPSLALQWPMVVSNPKPYFGMMWSTNIASAPIVLLPLVLYLRVTCKVDLWLDVIWLLLWFTYSPIPLHVYMFLRYLIKPYLSFFIFFKWLIFSPQLCYTLCHLLIAEEHTIYDQYEFTFTCQKKVNSLLQ